MLQAGEEEADVDRLFLGWYQNCSKTAFFLFKGKKKSLDGNSKWEQ